MNKTLAAALALVCAGALFAQVPADKAKPAPEKKAAAAPAKAPAPKPVEEPEESVVMIDDKAEPEYGKAAYSGETEDRQAVAGGIPYSYGQCRGVISEGGRSVLVFESLDDGTITFVQVALGRGDVSWKLLDRIPRSNE
ncbi:MAG TPA: hypothetical protein DEQ38_04155 [Elusimicrobia bacterium]|nr:MAG: hypothetical protein A2089_12775 [Elusimicrobia bacterium GWD2_63_28]HCC47296.1 hypothetical protein [Elusimicrobiota bacterium]